MNQADHIKKVFSERMSEVKLLVDKTNKSSVLVIQQFPVESDTVTKIPKVRESISNILAFIELGEKDTLNSILTLADGFFDNIVFDTDIKTKHSSSLLDIVNQKIEKSRLFFYSDINAWADSAVPFILQQEKGLHKKNILLCGSGILQTALLQRISSFGANILQLSNIGDPIPSIDSIDLIIGASLKQQSVPDNLTKQINPACNLYDIGIGNFSEKMISSATENGNNVFRIDIRAGMSSLVLKILETDYLITRIMGKSTIKNTHLVAGGIMGNNGAVIVDDINHPSSIIGVADGKGNVKIEPDPIDIPNIEFVERLIKRSI